ncbi:MAG: hypothetical protein P8P32_16760 [Akkermansiaceae bacterium]|nr:hypothetical protein [Akkermansiaceae bacterium]
MTQLTREVIGKERFELDRPSQSPVEEYERACHPIKFSRLLTASFLGPLLISSLLKKIAQINSVWYGNFKMKTISAKLMPILAFSTLGIQCKEDLTKSETISADSWQIETSNGQKIPAGWEPFNFDSFDEQDPFLLRRNSSSKWDKEHSWKVMTAGLKIPVGWEPFGYDGNDESDPVLLRQSSSTQWDLKQKWEIKTAGLKIPVGWEPFTYDCKDQSDPFVLRRSTSGEWNNKQMWEVTTSNGLEIPQGWEPFGYDWEDQSDPFLLRRCTTGNWDSKQKWEVKTSNGQQIPAGWEPFAYDSKDQSDPFLLRRIIN